MFVWLALNVLINVFIKWWTFPRILRLFINSPSHQCQNCAYWIMVKKKNFSQHFTKSMWWQCFICSSFVFQADSDALSTTSSVSPGQSPSYSNQSDDGSDIESKQRRPTPTIFSFLDRSYWKRLLLLLNRQCAGHLFLKAVFWTWFNSKGCLLFLFLDKRCAVGLSIRVDLERWSLILDCSSPAAAPKSRRHWHPHKWPHAFPTRFLHSSQKTWKKPGDCFC